MTTDKIEAILADYYTSYWLKDALKAALKRDPIDAMDDAELLAEVLKDRAEKALAFLEGQDHDHSTSSR